MKKLLLAFFLILGFHFSSFAACYLTVEGKHNLSQSALEQIAQIELSQYLEPISEAPPMGISEQDCLYKLTLTELNPGLMLTIKGPLLTSYAESDLSGIQAFQQTIFRAILKEDPSKSSAICQKHRRLMKKDCSYFPIDSKPEVKKLIVFDPLTGLTWQKDEAGKMNWKAAGEYCENLQLSGLSDWRLPNRTEIRSSYPIQSHFVERQDYYWSSTPTKDKYYAWGFAVSDGELFSDWIENRYHVRCVSGTEMEQIDVLPRDEPESPEHAVEETSYPSSEALGMNWAIALMYVSGYSPIFEIYEHNAKEQDPDYEDQGTILNLDMAFTPYYEIDSGLRFGARIGPLMYFGVTVDEEDYLFTAIPLEANVGYTIPIGANHTSAFFVKGGVSKLSASGEYVESETIGITGAAGMELMRNKKVSIGFEAGVDTASVKLKKYDCSESATPSELSSCKLEYENVSPIGFTASFFVVF